MDRAFRFLTAGSVDDGKSTLIGRLLLDSQALLADQIETLERRAAGQPIDLALVTDGLEAEREQGITIDVAHRYFATPRRKFIIADAPGHEQYTRNMVTAAAGSDAAVILVDVTKLDWRAAGGPQLLAQTRRHSLLAHALRVPNLVFAVNKLDALGDDAAAAFEAVSRSLRALAREAGFEPAAIVPTSALLGLNVALPSRLAGYEGPSLLEVLESLAPATEPQHGAFALPVQLVTLDPLGDGTGQRARVLAGRLAQGELQRGAEVEVFPSGQRARVAELRHHGDSVEAVEAGDSAGVLLDRHVDVSRGDWLATPGLLQTTSRFSATVAWLDATPAAVGRRYQLRHGNRWVPARLESIDHRLDIHTLAPTDAHELAANDLAEVTLVLQEPLPLARYADNRLGGSAVLVDATTNRTSAAVLVRESLAA